MPQIAVDEKPAQPPPATGVSAGDSGQGDDDRPSRRRRRKKKSKVPFVFGILSVPVLMVVIGLIVQGSGGSKEKERERPAIDPSRIPSVGQARRTTEDTRQPQQVAAAPAGYELVDSDRLLWVPPYPADSENIPLDLLPPGPAVIVSIRMSKVLADPIGGELIESLSPELNGLLDTVARRAGVPSGSIDRCTVALHAGNQGWPQASLAIELAEPVALSTLSEKWGVGASRTPEGATVYAGDEPGADAYYLGDSDKGAVASDATVRRFAVGSLEQIQEVAANEGGVIPLSRFFNKLWQKSSADSDLVALVTPNFLFADGRAMIQSTVPEMAEPLRATLIPDVAALLFSVSVGQEDMYAEMRVVPSGDVSETRMLRMVSDNISGLPAWAESFVVDAVPDPSWRLLATRMPFMLRFLVDHTRFGASDGTIVANAYLPGPAATQITLATLLAMNTKPGSGAAGAVASVAAKPLTMEEMLNRKMAVDFGQESLEFGINIILEQFAADLPDGSTAPKVRIIGGDLEKGGITQNQQIRDFSKADLPLRTVLTDLLLGANPDKTATGPKDPKQALVWVVSPDGSEILVTTRAASEGVYELPAEFKPDE